MRLLNENFEDRPTRGSYQGVNLTCQVGFVKRSIIRVRAQYTAD